MKIHCRSCHAPIAEEDILLDRSAAKCRKCGEVFNIGDLASKKKNETKSSIRAKLPRPQGLAIEESDSEVRIVYPWAGPSTLGLGLICLVGDGLLALWYWLAFFKKSEGIAPGWLMVAVSLPFLAIGSVMTYVVLLQLCNSTLLQAGNHELSVRHGPLPARADLTLPANQIDQLYYSDESAGSTFAWSPPYLIALLRDGTRVNLLGSLVDGETAGYVEQKLEEKLKIEDRWVPQAIEPEDTTGG